MINIRLLVAPDAELFKSLRLLAVESSPTSIWPTREEEMARSIEQTADRIQATPTQAVFGAFDGEVLAGITGIRREPLHQVTHKATIWGVFVNPSYRGQGIAQTLLAAATAHATEKWNSIQLMLCVNAENVAAKSLYVSQGFQTFGLEPRAMQVDGRFYDEEHMCKPLL
ncbi:GNAT family N-acetyltransferase [Paraburkholderia sp. Cpub6]|uniref:GNAT family N-acetyltransferase n=1 Tax=Paraburkholderia sp. Cpub6 TaxID=2723094 RepID=UPI001616E506|nr:GNAT family protein [Paraburkholderia sp. Cpub6]MBB5463576.1 ribosomal protein S18 acetylase RimI-like enzyme [Paraburkholderia sp. Cpub6]